MNAALGNVIATYRKAYGYKQTYMAFKLGLTTHAYANIEHGRCNISFVKLHSIANLFYVKPHNLIVLAEELIEIGNDAWLPDVVKGIVRLLTIKLEPDELTPEDNFLLKMDKKIKRITAGSGVLIIHLLLLLTSDFNELITLSSMS